ncbi:hypothetical protein HaLaN_28076, partial [Haematococcus lacustris]
MVEPAAAPDKYVSRQADEAFSATPDQQGGVVRSWVAEDSLAMLKLGRQAIQGVGVRAQQGPVEQVAALLVAIFPSHGMLMSYTWHTHGHGRLPPTALPDHEGYD